MPTSSKTGKRSMGMDGDELDLCKQVFEAHADPDMEWDELFNYVHWNYEQFIRSAQDYIPADEFDQFRSELTDEILDYRASKDKMMPKK